MTARQEFFKESFRNSLKGIILTSLIYVANQFVEGNYTKGVQIASITLGACIILVISYSPFLGKFMFDLIKEYKTFQSGLKDSVFQVSKLLNKLHEKDLSNVTNGDLDKALNDVLEEDKKKKTVEEFEKLV